MANRFCIGMKEQCEDESGGEQRARMQTRNALRDLILSTPCRRLRGNISGPIPEEEVAAIRERTRKVLLDKMERPIVLEKGSCLALRLPISKHRRLTIH